MFHISEKLNGIPLPSTNHLTGHPAYSTKIQSIINQLDLIAGNNNSKAYDELEKFISYLEVLIKNNTDKNLGEIANLINY